MAQRSDKGVLMYTFCEGTKLKHSSTDDNVVDTGNLNSDNIIRLSRVGFNLNILGNKILG